jgi:hypothetical protein
MPVTNLGKRERGQEDKMRGGGNGEGELEEEHLGPP